MTGTVLDKEERETPLPSKCLGIFNLSLETTEKDLHDLFFRYGEIEDVTLVTDKVTKRSRGFGFVYFKNIDDAEIAKEKLHKIIIQGKELRVDFSLSQRARTPTPGVYKGKKTQDNRRKPPQYERGNGVGYQARDRSEVRMPQYRMREEYDRREPRYEMPPRRPRDWTDYQPRRRESPFRRPHY